MSLLCFAGKHAARPSHIWNQGLYFSDCRRCGCGMVRADEVWEAVPRGFRIIWRPRERPDGVGPKDMIRNLPMIIPRAPLAPLPMMAPAPIQRRAAAQQSGFAQLVFLGAEMLAWSGAEVFRKWRRNFAIKRLQRHAIVLLLAH